MIITTSICANYLDKALVLANSVKQHCMDSFFVLCLVEDVLPPIKELEQFDRVVLAKDLGIPNFDNFIFQYDIVEGSTSVKGHLMSFLLQEFPDHNTVYIDPDCQVFSGLEELNDISLDQPIVLAPHLLEPGNVDMEISSLKHGVFNLGFLALRPCAEAVRFAKWWGDRLYHFSHADFNRGLFTDQKWINLAPCFFNIKVLRHPGYDFATWSFMERELTRLDSGAIEVNGEPLRFVHFSGFDSGTFRWAFKTWGSEQNQVIGESLAAQYETKLLAFSSLNVKKIRWSYGVFAGGEAIPKELRTYFSQNFGHFKTLNPFTARAQLISVRGLRRKAMSVVMRVARKVRSRLSA